MDVSANLATSLARAAEADAALIQELRLEDQIARDRMIAEAIQDGRRPTVETGYQYPLDDETFNILRQFNALAIESDNGEEERNPATDGTQNGQEAQQIQLTVHTNEIQDTVIDLEDGTQRFNPEEDLLGTTTEDKSANEPQETDSPGKIRIQEQNGIMHRIPRLLWTNPLLQPNPPTLSWNSAYPVRMTSPKPSKHLAFIAGVRHVSSSVSKLPSETSLSFHPPAVNLFPSKWVISSRRRWLTVVRRRP
ncbi:hypothetical protein ACHAPM_007279 [Fusarium culmorum]